MHDYTKVALATFVIDIGLIWILLSPPPPLCVGLIPHLYGLC